MIKCVGRLIVRGSLDQFGQRDRVSVTSIGLYQYKITNEMIFIYKNGTHVIIFITTRRSCLTTHTHCLTNQVRFC